MLPLLLRMKLQLTSCNQPAAAHVQPHACMDEIKQGIVFDVEGEEERRATVAKEIVNYNSGSKKKKGVASKTLIN